MAEENMASNTPRLPALRKDNEESEARTEKENNAEEVELRDRLNFIELEVNEEEMEALGIPQKPGSSGGRSPVRQVAKAVAIKVVETLVPYGIGAGALAATEGSAAAAEFAAAHLTALQASCGAVVAIVRVYFYVVGGAMTIGAVCGVGGGICYGIHQVMLDRRTGQQLEVDEVQRKALQAASRMNVARSQGKVDLEATVSAMRDHLKYPSVQVAGCLDLLQAVGTINNGKILESGLVEATTAAMDNHWDEEEVLKRGSEALGSLFDLCSEEEATTLRELGADLAIEKAKESLEDL